MATTKKNNTKKGCPVGQAWDISLGRCVDIDDDSQSLFGYSLKGGINWFGEDSPSDTMFSGTKNYKKEREAAAAKAKAAVAKKAPPKKVGGSIGTKKPKMAMGGATKTVIKKPLKTAMKPKMALGGTKKPLKPAMYGTAMKPTMMAKPSMMKNGGTKKKK